VGCRDSQEGDDRSRSAADLTLYSRKDAVRQENLLERYHSTGSVYFWLDSNGHIPYSLSVKYSLVFGFVTLVWAQTGNGTIAGSIKDASEAAIPGVKVKITNIETGSALDTVSNDAGLYRVVNLGPGSYRIAVEGDGFTPLSRGPVALVVGQTIAIDMTLQVGQQSQTVEVTEAAPLI